MKIRLKNFKLLSTADHGEVLRLRNLGYIRSQMAHSEIISSSNHVEWVKRLNDSCQYYAVLLDDEIIGNLSVTEIDLESKSCTWSCFFKDSVHAFIISLATIKYIDYVFNEMEIEKLNLFTKKTNLNALNFDVGLGFCEYKRDADYIYMTLDQITWGSLQSSELFKSIKRKIERVDFALESARFI